MNSINYIGTVTRILENPRQKILDNNLLVTIVRAQLPQIRSSNIVTLIFFGNLAQDVPNYYRVNDCILIEGYLTIQTEQMENLKILKKVEKGT